MRKAEELVANVAKSGNVKRLTVEQAFEKVLTDPANRALARAALRPASMKRAPSADDDGEEDESQASYEDDGGNTAHNPTTAVIGLLESDKDKMGRPDLSDPDVRPRRTQGQDRRASAEVPDHVPRRQRRRGAGLCAVPQEREEGLRGQAQGGVRAAPPVAEARRPRVNSMLVLAATVTNWDCSADRYRFDLLETRSGTRRDPRFLADRHGARLSRHL
jgi:hypothetical protein